MGVCTNGRRWSAQSITSCEPPFAVAGHLRVACTTRRSRTLLQPRQLKHAPIGFRVAPGGPAVAGRRTNAPPRRTGVPAAGEPKIGPGVRFFFDHPVLHTKGVKTLRPVPITFPQTQTQILSLPRKVGLVPITFPQTFRLKLCCRWGAACSMPRVSDIDDACGISAHHMFLSNCVMQVMRVWSLAAVLSLLAKHDTPR